MTFIENLTTEEYTFLSNACYITNIDNMVCYKINLDKFKRTEITQSIFSDYNGIKLEINKISRKIPNIRKLSNTALKSSWIKDEIKKETRKYFELNGNNNNKNQNL